MSAVPHEPVISYRDEVLRKLIHFASALLPIFYWLTNQTAMLIAVGALLAITLVFELLRHYHAGFRTALQARFGNLLRAAESGTLSGATYVLLANLIVVLWFDKPVAIAALLVLSFSDSAASLVGRRVRSPGFAGKTVAGCAAFFVSALILILIALPGRWLGATLAALAGTLAEALPPRIGGVKMDDNLIVPVVVGLVLQYGP